MITSHIIRIYITATSLFLSNAYGIGDDFKEDFSEQLRSLFHKNMHADHCESIVKKMDGIPPNARAQYASFATPTMTLRDKERLIMAFPYFPIYSSIRPDHPEKTVTQGIQNAFDAVNKMNSPSDERILRTIEFHLSVQTLWPNLMRQHLTRI